jgi:hypothetical protein
VRPLEGPLSGQGRLAPDLAGLGVLVSGLNERTKRFGSTVEEWGHLTEAVAEEPCRPLESLTLRKENAATHVGCGEELVTWRGLLRGCRVDVEQHTEHHG